MHYIDSEYDKIAVGIYSLLKMYLKYFQVLNQN